MKIADLDNTREIIAHLTHHGYYSEDLISSAMKGFTFYEFDLNDLGFPEPQELLAAWLAVKNQIVLENLPTMFPSPFF
jgi:hypothetical protein